MQGSRANQDLEIKFVSDAIGVENDDQSGLVSLKQAAADQPVRGLKAPFSVVRLTL